MGGGGGSVLKLVCVVLFWPLQGTVLLKCTVKILFFVFNVKVHIQFVSRLLSNGFMNSEVLVSLLIYLMHSIRPIYDETKLQKKITSCA
jgi:hypothetical protein